MIQKGIKNIIFDLGNVIINIAPENTSDDMQKFGFADFHKSYSLLNQTHLFDLLEKGEIAPEFFFEEINKQLINKINNEKIECAWNAMLLDFPEPRIKLIQQLTKKYRIFLLSNTNIIHYTKYAADFKHQFGFELDSLFEKAYYSFELGLRKPDKEIFEHVIQKSNLNPSETLFIDDSKDNIKTAVSLGFKTEWIDISKGDDITNKLNGF